MLRPGASRPLSMAKRKKTKIPVKPSLPQIPSPTTDLGTKENGVDVVLDLSGVDPQSLIPESKEKMQHELNLQEPIPKDMAIKLKGMNELNQISFGKNVNLNVPISNVYHLDGISWKDKLLYNRRLDALVQLHYGGMVAAIEAMNVEEEIQQ